MMDIKKILTMRQEQLAKFVLQTAKKAGMEAETDGRNYIIINAQDSNPLLASHLDIVGTKPPKWASIKEKGRVLSLRNNKTVLGGDDRAGVYIMLKLIEQGNINYSYAFFYNEEIGCIGSRQAVGLLDFTRYNCFIGLDRKGWRDVVDYGYTNLELMNLFKEYGYTEKSGSTSDVAILAEATGIACVNLSIGFLNEHTAEELLYIDAMERTLTVLQDAELQEMLQGQQYLQEYIPEENRDIITFWDYESAYEMCECCGDIKPSDELQELEGYGKVCKSCYNFLTEGGDV
jgi:putative aminopeptidase FrvX